MIPNSSTILVFFYIRVIKYQLNYSYIAILNATKQFMYAFAMGLDRTPIYRKSQSQSG